MSPRYLTISIHALLAESDPPVPYSITDTRKFLSTLSLRRATLKSPIKSHRQNHFYPRSPCGERLAGPSGPAFLFNFYPRSPCGERRPQPPKARVLKNFYPRSPCGERLHLFASSGVDFAISIHALLAESDSKSAQNSGALLRIWNKFYGDFIFMLTGKAVFYPFCPCFFHIFWCEGTGNFMIAFPSH